MGLNRNTYLSATNSISSLRNQKYALKFECLENWMYRNDYSFKELAGMIHIPVTELYRKLWERESFEEEQINRLIDLLTAREAIEVIFFPTMAEKIRIYKLVFEV